MHGGPVQQCARSLRSTNGAIALLGALAALMPTACAPIGTGLTDPSADIADTNPIDSGSKGDDGTNLDGHVNDPGVEKLSFRAGPSFCCSPLSIEFVAEVETHGQPSVRRISWEFGDGRDAQGQAVTHTYPWPGEFEVTLRVETMGGDVREHRRTLALRVDDLGTGQIHLRDDDDGDKPGETDDPGDADDLSGDGDTPDEDSDDRGSGVEDSFPDETGEDVSDDGADEDAEPQDDQDTDDDLNGAVQLPHRIMAMYGSASLSNVQPGGLVDDLLDEGLTDYIAKFGTIRLPFHNSLQTTLDGWVAAVQPANARFWPAFNWASSNELSWLQPMTRFVTSAGVSLTNTPCPRDTSFWEDGIKGRGVKLAQYSLQNPSVHGIVIDLELYASEDNRYVEPCFCEFCFREFLDEVAPSASVPPPNQRMDWLQANSSVQAYTHFERDAVAALAADARQAIHAVNPKLRLGGTGMIRDEGSFYDGFALGFGTPSKPLHEFSQRSYYSGVTDDLHGFVADFTARGIHAKLIAGLSLMEFPPEAISDHFFAGVTELSGSWIYEADSFSPAALAGHCHSRTEYLDALAFAVDEVWATDTDPLYDSSLAPGPFIPACASDAFVPLPANLIPLEDGAPDNEELRVRRPTAYHFHADAGEVINFELVLQQLGSQDLWGWWMLRAPDGTFLDEDAWRPSDGPNIVRTLAPQTGMYTLFMDPSWLLPISITNASHAGAYESQMPHQRLHLFSAHQLTPAQLYAYVPPGVTSVGVTVSGYAGEQTRVRIYDERDMATALYDATPTAAVDGDFQLVLSNPSGGAGVVLAIVLENAGGAEDFTIKFRHGALPYIAQTRSGLLRQP